jgi:protein-disulfide isomerase
VEAAGMQGKFWEMHAKVFENQRYLNRASVRWLADEIELNASAFETDRRNKKLFQEVISDFESGIRSGVNGTPTLFINGMRYNGFDDYQSLYKVCSYLRCNSTKEILTTNRVHPKEKLRMRV